MSLKDFQIAREEVAFRGGSLTFRGLSLNDVSFLIRDYLGELNRLFKMYETDEKRETAMQESLKFAVTVVQESPELVAMLIVLASDDDMENLPIARRLPLPVQVDSIRKIFELTFEEAGGAKKFIDSLVGMVMHMRPASKED